MKTGLALAACALGLLTACAGRDGVPVIDPFSQAFYDANTRGAERSEDGTRPPLGDNELRNPFPSRAAFAGIRREAGISSLERGIAFLRVGEPDLAHKAFIRALRVEEHKAAALTGAGIAVERQGLLSLAKRYFEAARTMAPQSDVAHNNLGAVLYALGEYGQAHQAFYAAYALSSGRNDMARRNMELSKRAMQAGFPEPDPLERSHTLERVGRNEYRLSANAPPSQ
ncbi:MAG: tetratricopeptide repeat protein [Pseudomonadota bacterium]